MSILNNISPKSVFGYFEKICSVPHGSKNVGALVDLIEEFAKENNLEYYRDAAENIIIKKPGTCGYENSESVIIQGHTDMVCEKEASSSKDMNREGIDLILDGDTITANATTLGADNGIAVAMAMALLAADDIPHPPIEAVFTSDEEIGMLGAAQLDFSKLSAKKMINIDSEDEGIFTVSCAGGCLAEIKIPVSRCKCSAPCYRIKISGLSGGHSGVEIHKGRANSNMLMGRLLGMLAEGGNINLVSADGGLKDNAIPVETACVVSCDADIEAIAEQAEKIFCEEYRVTDKNISVDVCPTEADSMMDSASTKKVIALLNCAPNGIIRMSADIEGLVQTSLNMGVLKTNADNVYAGFCVRSSVATEKDMLLLRLSVLADTLGADFTSSGHYPGWEYMENSHLRQIFIEEFEKQYGRSPKIEAIHAGLECGLFSGMIDGLDCISIGPDLSDIHTPRESVSVSSVGRTWDLVLAVLKRLK